MKMWFKIIVACIPAAVVGLLFDDILEKYLYNPITVAVMLILFGIGFILVEIVIKENVQESAVWHSLPIRMRLSSVCSS